MTREQRVLIEGVYNALKHEADKFPKDVVLRMHDDPSLSLEFEVCCAMCLLEEVLG